MFYVKYLVFFSRLEMLKNVYMSENFCFFASSFIN